MSDLSKRFPWGRVIEDHAIGRFTIREYHNKNSDFVLFHGFVDGKDAHESWLTIEDAIVGLIVLSIAGLNNRQIAQHFMAGLRAIAEDS